MNSYALALAFAVAAIAGWAANGWRLGEQMQEERNQWAATEKARVDADRTEADNRALTQWSADQYSQQEINNHEAKLSELERCIAAGRGCGLRIRIAKPAACVSAGEDAGLGAGAVETAELDDSARPAYRALRTGIVRLESALKVCTANAD